MDLTPEERLFKVIQDNEASGNKSDAVLAHGESEGGSAPRRFRWKWRLPLGFGFGHAGAASGPAAGGPVLSVHTLNGILFVVLLALLSYFVVGQVLFRKPSGDKLKARAEAPSVVSLEIPAELFSVREVESRRDLLEERNVFQPTLAQGKPRAVQTPEFQPTSSNLSAVAGNLKLTGTFLSDRNEALIELLDEKRTVSVPEGGTIKGVTVKAVRSDAVILSDGVTEFVLQ